MAQSPDLTVSSLRGGLNDIDPSIALGNDSCTLAENVEFFYSTLGERRLGCTVFTDMPTAISGDANMQAVTWMGAHYPDNTLGDVELWVLAQHLTAANYKILRRTTTTWSTITPTLTPTVTSGLGHKFSGTSLHGKFFLAYKSGTDRLPVWDGSSLRMAGLSAPAVPGVANTGGGTYSGTRYFRVRYTTMSGSTVLRRSEPSTSVSFSPSGAGSGTLITRPALIGEGETHWEVEASQDNANFYRLSQVVVGTTTYTDSTAYSTGYQAGNTLSEALTAYTLIPSGKFVTVDQDRLIIAGSWENTTYNSRIWWTPVLGDTGNGNDERLDMTVNPYIDLDGYAGGEITGVSKAVNGYMFAFKWSHIYKLVRTGQRSQAYSAVPLTKSRGALPGSLVEAVDQAGNPALYFLDPTIGPMRIGNSGLEWCGRDLVTTWRRVNLSATVPAFGVYYQSKNQVHFWISVDGADHPNFKIVLQCQEMSAYSQATFFSGPVNGARRGWATVPVGNRISDAHCALMFSSNADSANTRNLNLVPFIGKEQWTVSGNTIKDIIQRCDTGTSDAFTTGDTSAYYYASVQTKTFLPTGLLQRHGLMAGTLVAEAISSPANNIYVQVSRDFGTETIRVDTSLNPETTETVVVKKLDQLNFSNLTAVQFKFGDLNTNINPATSWRLHAFTAKIRPEQSS